MQHHRSLTPPKPTKTWRVSLSHLKNLKSGVLVFLLTKSWIDKIEILETPAISSFDLQSKPPYSCSLDNNINISSSSDFRSSESLATDTPNPNASEFPVIADPKCETMQSVVVNAAGDAVGPTEMASEVDALSESSAAVKLQKVYRGHRTRRRLADSAVVAEEFWWQALEFARLNHSTVSFFNFSKRESVASKWNRVSWNASKVGKGLSNDVKAQKLARQHWIEAIDPRHRYGHSLHLYYEEWRKTDAGQPFFHWLDIGDGKELDLKECPRSKLRQQCIIYLGPQERERFEYIVGQGKIVHNQTGVLLDTNKGSEGAKWIFVMSTSKKLYAGEKKKGLFHHSSFLAGGATIAAGRLVAEHGALKSISRYSGHYRPTDDCLDIFLSVLKEHGVNLDEVQIHKASEDSDCFDDGKSYGVETTVEALTNLNPLKPEIREEEEKNLSLESSEVNQTVIKSEYKRTLSGGLQSPRADVPKTAILQRINSKKTAKSYQLGHQLSRKWSTGAGPRIGCVADYPVQLRVQALEFVNLSPRTSYSTSLIASLASPTAPPVSPTGLSTSDLSNGDGTSGV